MKNLFVLFLLFLSINTFAQSGNNLPKRNFDEHLILPDLIITSVTLAPQLHGSKKKEVLVTFKNVGLGRIEASEGGLVFNYKPRWEEDRFFGYGINVPPLAPGESFQYRGPIPKIYVATPAIIGFRKFVYAFADTDNNILESNERNNRNHAFLLN